MTTELFAELLEFGAQRFEVVNFAVEGDYVAAAGRMHRLGAHRREIDDREPTVAEGDAGVLVNPHTVGIRSAVAQTGCHASSNQRELLAGLAAGSIEKTCDAAHRFFCLRATRLRSERLLRWRSNSGASAGRPGTERIRFCRPDARP